MQKRRKGKLTLNMFERAIGNQLFYKLSKYIHEWTYTNTKMQTYTHIYTYILNTIIIIIIYYIVIIYLKYIYI